MHLKFHFIFREIKKYCKLREGGQEKGKHCPVQLHCAMQLRPNLALAKRTVSERERETQTHNGLLRPLLKPLAV